MKRIIFLDIDGVLAGYSYLCKGKGFIDPKKVKLLNTLKDLNVEIVISSSWGTDADEPLRKLGLELPIIGHTEHLSLHCEYLCRGNEIEKWINDNIDGMGTKFGSKYTSSDFRYVIFDDDSDFLLGQKDNFIKTNERYGLTKRDINKARKILIK